MLAGMLLSAYYLWHISYGILVMALMLFYGVLHAGRDQQRLSRIRHSVVRDRHRFRRLLNWIETRFWPSVAQHRWLSAMLPRIERRRARERYYHWKNRLVFACLIWTTFATFIMTSMS